MKNTHIRTKALAIIFIILVGYFLWKIIDTKKTYINNQTEPKQNLITPLKTYKSNLLKFQIKISGDWKISEKYTNIELINPSGEILITRIGTNFNNINQYMDDLVKKNKTNFVEKKYAKVNNNDSIYGIIKQKSGDPEKKIYFIYTDYRIYTFSTPDPELYDDLDAIVQTFRHIP